MKKIALIGSTGSIGRQAVEVALRYPDRFRIVALAANTDAGRRAGPAGRRPPPRAGRAAHPPRNGGRQHLLVRFPSPAWGCGGRERRDMTEWAIARRA